MSGRPRYARCLAALLPMTFAAACQTDEPTAPAPASATPVPPAAPEPPPMIEQLAVCAAAIPAWDDASPDARAARLLGDDDGGRTACNAAHPYRHCFDDPALSRALLTTAEATWPAVVMAMCIERDCPSLTPKPALCDPATLELAVRDALPQAIADFHRAMLVAHFDVTDGPRLADVVQPLTQLWLRPVLAANETAEQHSATEASFRVVITPEGFELSVAAPRAWPGSAGAPPSTTHTIALRGGVHDTAALATAAEAVSRSFPEDHRVTIAAESTIPFEVMIDAMKSLTGPDCVISPTEDPDPEHCFFWEPVVQAVEP